jgi:redox-sensitive bicupin YhaK (pirin superfamily)
MIIHRPKNTRGNVWQDWINSFRIFSFPGYFNPKYRNFGHLQTINDDRVQPEGHVPIHEHKNMEIFGYVVDGVCRHTDSDGRINDIPAGGVQRMSCGKGFKHTEGNSTDTPNRYLQLWVTPNVFDTEPIYDWHQFTREDKLNKFCDITEKLPIKQDAKFLSGIFTEDYIHKLSENRMYYLYVVLGSLTINGFNLVEGDSLSFIQENVIEIKNPNETEVILFDLINFL